MTGFTIVCGPGGLPPVPPVPPVPSPFPPMPWPPTSPPWPAPPTLAPPPPLDEPFVASSGSEQPNGRAAHTTRSASSRFIVLPPSNFEHDDGPASGLRSSLQRYLP